MQIFGGGKMGGSIARGLVARGEAVRVVEPDRSVRAALALAIPGLDLGFAAVEDSEAVIAVKPHLVAEVTQMAVASGAQRILSIAAGVRLAELRDAAGEDVELVRAMPNLGAAVGHSASAFSPGRGTTDETAQWAKSLLEAVGIAVQVTESQMDAVTGLSGSGPAYFFCMVEALAAAGVAEGLEEEHARMLSIGTLQGAAALLNEEPDPKLWRERVTTPNGTTAAGLAALEAKSFDVVVAAGVAAATKRSHELGA